MEIRIGLDEAGWIAGSRCLAAGLLAKEDATAQALFRAAARYFGKGLPPLTGEDGQQGHTRDTNRGLVRVSGVLG